MALKCPTEIAITDRREKELSDLGFLAALSLQEHRLRGLLRRARRCRSRRSTTRTRPTPTRRISARLPYIMAASRFAHYLKVMVRDKIGSFQTQADMQST